MFPVLENYFFNLKSFLDFAVLAISSICLASVYEKNFPFSICFLDFCFKCLFLIVLIFKVLKKLLNTNELSKMLAFIYNVV